MRKIKKKPKSKNITEKKSRKNYQQRLREKLREKIQYDHHQKLYKKGERFTSRRLVSNTISLKDVTIYEDTEAMKKGHVKDVQIGHRKS